MNRKLMFIVITSSFLVACQEELSNNQPIKETREVKEISKPKTDNSEKISKKEIEILKQQTDIVNSTKMESEHLHQFDEEYTDIKGILTYRGSHHRDVTSVGKWNKAPETYHQKWAVQTDWNHEWGGGAGWTGQPLIIEWHPNDLKNIGVDEKFKTGKLVEVVQASLDGKVYFIDFETGAQTRDPINIGNPIKGTPTLDPRGYPLLFVGEGIPQDPNISLNAINLITNQIIYKFPGMDSFANRGWGAFDGSPLISKQTDTLVTNGENGIVYNIKLNTEYDRQQGNISITPEKNKMIFNYPKQKTGLESSIVAEKSYLFTADNKGKIQAIDSKTMKTLWSTESYDDTDSTMLFTKEEDNYYLYTASEIDKQGEKGYAKIRKINAENGKIIWEKLFPGFSITGDDPVNGGFLASPLKGQGKLAGQMIFTMARGESLHSGYIVSLNMKTGEEVWKWQMNNYAWSSPVGTQDTAGNFYIVQMDSVGNVMVIQNGEKEIMKFNVGANVEATPIIYENHIIFASRGGQIYNYELK